MTLAEQDDKGTRRTAFTGLQGAFEAKLLLIQALEELRHPAVVSPTIRTVQEGSSVCESQTLY